MCFSSNNLSKNITTAATMGVLDPGTAAGMMFNQPKEKTVYVNQSKDLYGASGSQADVNDADVRGGKQNTNLGTKTPGMMDQVKMAADPLNLFAVHEDIKNYKLVPGRTVYGKSV